MAQRRPRFLLPRLWHEGLPQALPLGHGGARSEDDRGKSPPCGPGQTAGGNPSFVRWLGGSFGGREGDKGQQEFKGDSIRSFFGGIRSNLIWIEPQFNLKGWPEEFIIYGGGWGHGVGMCQVGAHGLASAGKSSEEILKHYFPKARLEKL